LQKMPEHKVSLSKEERSVLSELISRGPAQGMIWRRANVLFLLDSSPVGKNWSIKRIFDEFGSAYATVQRIAERYATGGLDAALGRKRRVRSPRKDTSDRTAQVLAVVDSKPPDGRTRWTIGLIVDELHRRGITDGVSTHSVWTTLDKAGIKLASQNSAPKRLSVSHQEPLDMTAQVLAIVGSKPPYGRRLWANDLIMEELRRRGIREGVSPQAVSMILEKAGIDLKHGTIAAHRRVKLTFS
jgi:transposase